MESDRLLTVEQLADYLGVPVATVYAWRHRREGPGPGERTRATLASPLPRPRWPREIQAFTRKVDAQRWLDQVTADLVTGRYVDPKAGRVTLGDFAAQWLDGQTFDASTRQTTASRVRTHILPTIGHFELRHLKPSNVQAWVRSRQTEVAPS